jgi:hypothetical protein
MLIAAGAVLAFAVDVQTTGVDLTAVGWILVLVGFIGLAISFLMLGEGGYFGSGGGRHTTYVDEPAQHTTVVETTPRVEETTVERTTDVPGSTTTTRRVIR